MNGNASYRGDFRDDPRSDPRWNTLRRVQRKALEAAMTRWDEGERGERSRAICGVLMTRGRFAGEICHNPAGLNTVNAGDAEESGVGPCWAHGGARLCGRAEAGWMLAHRFAQEYSITPWEGLLKAVRIAAGKVAYTEWVMSQAKDNLELEGRFGRNADGILMHPDTGELLGGGQLRNLTWWVMKNELWVDRLARYSKAAIDAGVAERLVEIEQAHAEQVAGVLNGVINALEAEDGIDHALLGKIRAIMRGQLLQLDTAPHTQMVEGETV
jgi:hypothetical protein